ncbi:MAG TPA: phosphoribosylglycinamide formyltransferase [Rhizomicrobium sp.]|nr:phosphoribosylglycinamide formyltransferase [Rhizomicrobium sp.]
MTPRAKVGVLVSGRGSNLQALIDACAGADFPAEIVCVISNVASVEGLARAERAGIATHVIAHGGFKLREEFDMELDAVLTRAAVSLVCLAGFMRVLSDVFVEKWRGRLINIHPSLLPGFKGLDVHGRVLASGARISGCTVHFVAPELDSGPIIAQAAVPVMPNDTEETLAARTLAAEHRLYPHALKLLAEGRVKLEGERAVFTNISEAEGTLVNPPLD